MSSDIAASKSKRRSHSEIVSRLTFQSEITGAEPVAIIHLFHEVMKGWAILLCGAEEACLAHNQKVGGSKPSPDNKFSFLQ